jgi:hypothetical protein
MEGDGRACAADAFGVEISGRRKSGRLNTSIVVPSDLKDEHSRLKARGLSCATSSPVLLRLPSELVEVFLRTDLEANAGAFCLVAFAQDHRMMVDCIGQ